MTSRAPSTIFGEPSRRKGAERPSQTFIELVSLDPRGRHQARWPLRFGRWRTAVLARATLYPTGG